MSENILLSLAGLLLMAIGAQWLAWKIRIPSILILLFLGFLVGPILNLFDPNQLMGDLLFPVVSLSVGIILFEGGLTLRFKELPTIKTVITRLVSSSALITWGLVSITARYILDLSWPIAILLGAIMIVTGPTVVGPLLRQIRPKGRIGAVLKWEGILIDPVGAIIAVLVFEAISASEAAFQETALVIMRNIGITIMVGGFLGIATAALITFILWRRLVPDYLQNAVTLMLVSLAFALSDFLQHESGLITTTVIGIILANQSYTAVRHIEEFTENVQVMLIGALFILLSARISLEELALIGPDALIFLLILILIVRPISVFLAIIGSSLSWKEWLFASVMAPRGIVAAAVASIFAFELTHEGGGPADANLLVPLTFVVIVGTVLFYGLAADPISRALGLSEKNPQGVLFVGAHLFARAIAKALKDQGFRTMLMDINRQNLELGARDGLETHYGNALSEHVLENLDLSGIGRMLALTANNEINSLASLHFPEVFSRAEVYQLATKEQLDDKEAGPPHLRGRFLFDEELTFNDIVDKLSHGATVEVFNLANGYTADEYISEYGERAIPLFAIDERRQLQIATPEIPIVPQNGHTVISLVSPPTVVEPDHEHFDVDMADTMDEITHEIYQPEEE